jgi:hypothetical protein
VNYKKGENVYVEVAGSWVPGVLVEYEGTIGRRIVTTHNGGMRHEWLGEFFTDDAKLRKRYE